ncbi:MAG: NYN domain-containing protein [Desulfobacterales bacterium]|nr:NYN domain-containing protein [Desulfobacterales bacterium]MDD4072238.1 NYN domain-containing protein [Desulfobacterales bacterium]MDD4392967.1 NYN domain-containing protein [Desulfobacterales bacterium]
MTIHIIIDGYNLIRQSTALSPLDQQDIQLGREALIERLVHYRQIKHHKITIVFDGANAPVFSNRRDRIKGIHIEFSGINESADTLIKKMAGRERQKALVVSSDLDIVHYSTTQGASTISSPEFEEKIDMALFMDLKGFDLEADGESGWVPTTKKKGPTKRLPRRQRQSRIKIQKL